MPGRDGWLVWFGLTKAVDKALNKARAVAAKNCGSAGFEELESGKVTVGREIVEGKVREG